MVPAKPKAVFQASAVDAFRVPKAAICAPAAAAALFAAALAPHTLVNWLVIWVVMMVGLSASSCPALMRGSMPWKVNSVSARPSSPASNFIVGTQSPKSRPEMVDGWNPPKFPVTALVTAPNPTEGDVQTRVSPLPVQVPSVPAEDAAEATVVAATAVVASALAVASAAADVACHYI